MEVRPPRARTRRAAIEDVLVGQSPAIVALRRQVVDLAGTPADVLVQGETGTGKELVARCLHEHGSRRGPLVAVNCGGLPEALFESELFGHEAGAFSGAMRRRVGQVEFANHGTLLLDEIESMPLTLQVKLLRVLQERSVQRLGANTPQPLDLRVVAATKEDLGLASAQGRFRADLYYRLNVAVLRLPSLRERREDIPLLFGRFVAQAAARYVRAQPEISPALLRRLMAQPWPGNVRELRNAADRLVLGMADSTLVGLAPEASARLGLNARLDRFERTLLEEALARAAGDLEAVCEELELPRRTLYDKLRRHGLSLDRYRAARS